MYKVFPQEERPTWAYYNIINLTNDISLKSRFFLLCALYLILIESAFYFYSTISNLEVNSCTGSTSYPSSSYTYTTLIIFIITIQVVEKIIIFLVLLFYVLTLRTIVNYKYRLPFYFNYIIHSKSAINFIYERIKKN